MKQGTTFILPVKFGGVNLDTIERIEFIFKPDKRKGSTRGLRFVYPSDKAVRREDIVDLYWTEEDTWRFDANELVCMDTKIWIKGSTSNPQTPIIKLVMNETLFERGETYDHN